MSTERIIVVDAIADEFVKRLAVKTATLKAGDPGEGKTPLGAMVDIGSVERVQTLIADAVSKGARLSSASDADGVLVPAQMLDGVTSAMKVYSEESFGPVVSVIRARDEEDAFDWPTIASTACRPRCSPGMRRGGCA